MVPVAAVLTVVPQEEAPMEAAMVAGTAVTEAKEVLVECMAATVVTEALVAMVAVEARSEAVQVAGALLEEALVGVERAGGGRAGE